ncbi:sensor histidine kinase [Shewanella woodyi]|uniref:Signal transduction histidine kinase, LytS n=1 Tax=Shewanella woodyi (strain ATCC 51908 / MS32) TaxID=392500 RepID=B1KJG1_SHEWM|nr:histidine kinase [Shewanella woodyi]ACA88633.1 signal transduction histidine kinase, LytS [Shewanella woodyi ATCC 51908]
MMIGKLNTSSLMSNKNAQLWLLVLGYWCFVSVISLFTLTLWYGAISWLHIGHTIIQSALGFILSFPLYFAVMAIWEQSLFMRVLKSILLTIFVALIWTVARLAIFIHMTTFDDQWNDFGGWLFGSIFIYLGLVGFFHGMKYFQLLQNKHDVMLKTEAEIKEEQIKTMRAQTVARDAQIKMLRYQLNPHFLCNTLNAINSLIEIEEPKKAQRMAIQLSKFLRYSLDNNPNTKITLENELNALNLYLEIEKTRFSERLKLDFNIDKQALQASIPSLLLQPIIENSMKHVIAKNENGGTIRLSANITDHQLVLVLSDTGSTNIDSKMLKSSKGRGIGLRNIDERLKILYGNDFLFELNIMASGALKTTIKIPYEPLNNSS